MTAPRWISLAGCRDVDPELFFSDDETTPGWQELALCAEVDAELFFPERGGPVKAAKRICARCPVRAECGEYALANGIAHGVWGGLSENDRRAIRRSERSVA